MKSLRPHKICCFVFGLLMQTCVHINVKIITLLCSKRVNVINIISMLKISQKHINFC